jgi:8-oxo-dGTP pyrophosphatase MutT (NUDIX family)
MQNEHTQVDSRLNDIDDCLYRVAARVLIVQNKKVLLVKEVSDEWWAIPGGGVDHGESIESTLLREIQEELGVPAQAITADFQIAHYTIGSVVNGVPRMNLFFKAFISEETLRKTDHVVEWKWFTKSEFMNADLHASYNKAQLATAIFDE